MDDTEQASLNDQEVYKAVSEVIQRVLKFDPETRRRIFETAETFFQLSPRASRPFAGGITGSVSVSGDTTVLPGGFADREERSPKDFMFQKRPITDVERIACLAYYLAHFRDTRHFKTIDISKLNTEAAQAKFSNTAYAVVNATHAGLLVPAAKGFKQLSALGERYVDALPDRSAAREVLAAGKLRRGRKRVKNGRISAKE